MDEFIALRLDRKGLILTTSYDWQKLIMERSRFSDLMIGNSNEADSESAADVAEQFYKMAAPRILVSPSFSRGWDFSFKRGEYCIIPKCPFVPLQSKVMKARLERDPLYGDHVTMKKVEQGNGRIKRAPDDRGETILMDGHFVHFLKKDSAKKLAQRWFLDSVKTVYEIPSAPAKIA
jgi:Rad3-related DNA helicase